MDQAMTPPQALGAALRQHFQNRGWDQSRCRYKLGLSEVRTAHIFHGLAVPTADEWSAMCSYFSVGQLNGQWKAATSAVLDAAESAEPQTVSASSAYDGIVVPTSDERASMRMRGVDLNRPPPGRTEAQRNTEAERYAYASELLRTEPGISNAGANGIFERVRQRFGTSVSDKTVTRLRNDLGVPARPGAPAAAIRPAPPAAPTVREPDHAVALVTSAVQRVMRDMQHLETLTLNVTIDEQGEVHVDYHVKSKVAR